MHARAHAHAHAHPHSHAHAGFALLETGLTSAKNSQNIMAKNMLDLCVTALAWWSFGHALAFGEDAGGFLGASQFFASSDHMGISWFLHMGFCANAATIFGGCIQGRSKFAAFVVAAASVSAWVYPVVAHWVWTETGWLANLGANGLIDFSGSGVVHMVGGIVGFVGCHVMGPRLYRFGRGGKPRDLPGHNALLASLGVFVLWVGWYAFNSVPAGDLAPEHQARVAGNVMVTTTMAPAAAGASMFAWRRHRSEPYALGELGNAVLAGLVSITAGCAVVEAWAAVVIGVVAAAVYDASNKWMLRHGMDDPLAAAPIHMFGGMWGLVSVGLFARPELVAILVPDAPYRCAGVFYGDGLEQLGVQLVGVVAMLAWCGAWATLIFRFLEWRNMLRVDRNTELGGLDVMKHGSSGYPEFTLVNLNVAMEEEEQEEARAKHPRPGIGGSSDGSGQDALEALSDHEGEGFGTAYFAGASALNSDGLPLGGGGDPDADGGPLRARVTMPVRAPGSGGSDGSDRPPLHGAAQIRIEVASDGGSALGNESAPQLDPTLDASRMDASMPGLSDAGDEAIKSTVAGGSAAGGGDESGVAAPVS